ncbi:hypothetical protein QUB29_29410 [Microcoleus sp. B4b_D2]|uniref:hypothetical protein n=1 Tax=unclassified Microcoleus TaxID=2642155 RepID=UPI002FD3D9E6
MLKEEGRGSREEGRFFHSLTRPLSHSPTPSLAHSPTLTSFFENGGCDRTIEMWLLSRY